MTVFCLRRAHQAALSLELLGISHAQTGLESRSAALTVARALQGLASDEEESPEARHSATDIVKTRWLLVDTQRLSV